MKKNKFYLPIIHLLLLLYLFSCSTNSQNNISSFGKKSISVDGNQIRIYSESLSDTIEIVMISDTHLHMKDEREIPFVQYSKRMSEAYNVTKHYRNGDNSSPDKLFVETINMARSKDVDLLALAGDIFSYPSELAIEWVDSILNESNLNYAYTAGNHDWHYEGMEGSTDQLRETWINKRLLPLYDGENPFFYFVDVKGVRIILIDNSTYEITADQLTFFEQQADSRLPLLLIMHIPLYMPGRAISYGCGHPDWEKENDNSYELERRPHWPEKGHSPTTIQFRERVLNTPNLLAVFTGHIHQQTLDIIHDLPLFTVKENASGNYFYITIMPMP